ncbi:pre-mRNA-splicing factor SPF27 isoform X2 [Rhinatrema bivittatum]|uniref:pre-mRNA-splicing factor SPF27 isoform X2 n=1 Tax=Rhinatrema bivittatum TaxID=194408 RepID=UPI00112A4D7E|nr:pre-mRNA-splicing factor SPF27 isoform X2 [Rhinatrema bivittatum]
MAGTGLVAGDVVVDALPYFDQGYDAAGVREAAAALVEEETRRYRPTKNYLSYLPTPDYSAFETEIMRNEFERLAARQPLELLSMKRYELPAPSSGQKNDITAWQECVNNSMAQLEHQAVRIENLELMSQYGCNAWKVYNENLVHLIEQSQKDLQKLRACDTACPASTVLVGQRSKTLGSGAKPGSSLLAAIKETNPGPKLAAEKHTAERWGEATRNGVHVGVAGQ